ncbi:hypothetical protein ACVWZV_007189 [Bradyrhizobium sp. GM5.1]
MTDENLVLNRYALAYESVRRNLAACTHFRPDLNFDESADPGLVANLTAIEVDQLRMKYPDVTTEFYILRYWHGCSPRLCRT